MDGSKTLPHPSVQENSGLPDSQTWTDLGIVDGLRLRHLNPSDRHVVDVKHQASRPTIAGVLSWLRSSFKRAIWAAVVPAVVASFAGCGGGASGTFAPQTSSTSVSGTNGDSGSSAPTQTPKPTPAPAPETPAGSGTVIDNIQAMSGNWRSWGQVEPDYIDCSPSPCDGVEWSMKQGITLPSLSNNATQFNLGGTTPYGDVLFSAGVIGQNAPQLPDSDHTLLSTLHSFIYDADFYVTNPAITQSLEFDISLSINGMGMTWGHQCNYLGDKNWDIWDNKSKHWNSTGAPCKFVKGWNHVTIQVQKNPDNTLLYQSIELNGTTYTLNKTSEHSSVPVGWWGLNVNYQMDGDYKQSPNTTYLDNLSLTYE